MRGGRRGAHCAVSPATGGGGGLAPRPGGDARDCSATEAAPAHTASVAGPPCECN